ncbi:MAG: UvrD-helicase domain-containing protein [Synergistaceae bacterium]|nr:UvrD-helicase domain-containing protein [Synergistaceae bacterium]
MPTTGNDILDGLNDEQREAVTSTEGFIRVVAGAGSGKTRALSRRFAWLVNELGILPGNILCVTFSNKSAGEMQRRIHNLIGDNDTGYINTFHGFCLSVLQEEAHIIQYPRNFMVLDNADIDSMLNLIYEERGLTLRHMSFSQARDRIEIRKTLIEPEYYWDMIAMPLEPLRSKYENASDPSDIIFYGYLYQEKKCFGLDYNDLILLTLHVFDKDEETRLKWQQRLEYIMIDEFQDIDRLQYRLMETLCGYHKNLFIVGDPDQTIYTWRGANVRYFLDFDKEFPAVKTLSMMRNYRSTPQIIAAANSLISKNSVRMEKSLLPTLPEGEPVACFHADNSEGEALWIAGEIEKLHENGTEYRDLCVLYRAHYVTRTIEDAFIKAKIPYTIYSGVPFFERREIRDALAYLRMIAFRDDLSFARIVNVPRRNMGERRMKFLREYAAQNGCTLWEALNLTVEQDIFKGTRAAPFIELIEGLRRGSESRPVSELLAETLDASGYDRMLRTAGAQDRLDNLAELEQSVHEYEATCGEEAALSDYLARIALFSGADAEDKRDRVKLMTVHAAKGLEFPYVFLCALNEGIFPSRKTRTREGMEEERRLAFVAMTRAQKGLYLSEAGGRNLDGSPRYPSRFLLNIDESLLNFIQRPKDSLIADAREYIAFSRHWLEKGAKTNMFSAGQRVRHRTFGDGVILEVDQGCSAYLVRFDNLPTPRSLSFTAPLQVIAPSS